MRKVENLNRLTSQQFEDRVRESRSEFETSTIERRATLLSWARGVTRRALPLEWDCLPQVERWQWANETIHLLAKLSLLAVILALTVHSQQLTFSGGLLGTLQAMDSQRGNVGRGWTPSLHRSLATVMQALQNFGSPAFARSIARFVDHRSLTVRMAAAKALSTNRHARAESFLVRALRKARPWDHQVKAMIIDNIGTSANASELLASAVLKEAQDHFFAPSGEAPEMTFDACMSKCNSHCGHQEALSREATCSRKCHDSL
eukprot:3936647-Rhodomonas_salina.1